MKKTLSLAFICALCFSMAITCAGCSISNVENSKQPSQVVDDDTQNNVAQDDDTQKGDIRSVDARKRADTTAEEIAKTIMEERWDDLLGFLGLEDVTFLSGSDLEWYVPRSSFKDLLTIGSYQSIESEIVNDAGTIADVSVSVSVDEDNVEVFRIPVRIDGNNIWNLDASEFYVSDWTIKATGGNVELFVNGQIVDEKYKDGKLGVLNQYDKWVIPAIGKRTAKVELKAKSFGIYMVECEPEYNAKEEESYVSAVVIGDLDTENEVYEAIKNLWNESYADFALGKPAADCRALYTASEGDQDIIDNLWSYYTSIEKGIVYKYNDFRITDIGPSMEDGAINVFYITDTVICCNFGYRLEWVCDRSSGGAEAMTRVSSVYLQKDNGQYRFWKLTDEKLFTYCNNYTDVWKNS